MRSLPCRDKDPEMARSTLFANDAVPRYDRIAAPLIAGGFFGVHCILCLENAGKRPINIMLLDL